MHYNDEHVYMALGGERERASNLDVIGLGDTFLVTTKASFRDYSHSVYLDRDAAHTLAAELLEWAGNAESI